MTRYRYRALDGDGAPCRGEVDGDSPYALTQALASQGYTVTGIEAVEPHGLARGRAGRLGWEDLRLFSQQLASITRSGYPLAPALKAMAQDLHRPRLRNALELIHGDLERGVSLSEALGRQRHRFPSAYVALIQAGEVTGNLSAVLDLMTRHASKMTSARHRFKLAMIYPVVLMLSTLFVLANLLLFTIPVFADVFVEMEAELPASTRLLIYLSEVFRAHWPVISATVPLAVGALISGYVAVRQTDGGRYATDWLKLYLPSIGACYYGAVQARFCYTLGLLLAARVPVVSALDLAGASAGCAVLERGCLRAADSIAAGERLTDSLRQTRFFGHNFVWLLGTGEDRGGVEEALENLADSFDRETQARERTLGMFTAPMLTAIIGLIIGFIVVAMYLPIFTLGDQMGGQ